MRCKTISDGRTVQLYNENGQFLLPVAKRRENIKEETFDDNQKLFEETYRTSTEIPDRSART